jgi:ubiquinone/menaquinone biosynthesis C-methylase UbiE
MSGHDHHDHPDHGHDHGRVPGDFDSMAATWDDDPSKVERASVVAARIVERLAPGPDTRLLEYGAGTGLVTQALAGHVGAVTLADPSEGMRAAMAAKVDAGTLPAHARIVSLDLGAGLDPGDRYDLAVAVQVFHHVPDLDPVLAGFATVIEPGGHLCIVDLEQEDGSFHGEGFGGHHGFDRQQLGEQIRSAGFRDVTFEHCFDVERDGRTYPLFLAIAAR